MTHDLAMLDGHERSPARAGADSGTRGWLLQSGDEIFRGIYTRARIVPEVIAITSPAQAEGKTTVCIGIAQTLAADFPDRRVVLVETDLRAAGLASDFALAPQPGLRECLIESRLVPEALRPTAIRNLWLVPSAGPSLGSERLLRSERLRHFLTSLRAVFDYILVDAPAVLTDSDGLPVTALADAVLLVVRAAVNTPEEVDRAVAQIDPSKMRGTVLNGERSAVPSWLLGRFSPSSARR